MRHSSQFRKIRTYGYDGCEGDIPKTVEIPVYHPDDDREENRKFWKGFLLFALPISISLWLLAIWICT